MKARDFSTIRQCVEDGIFAGLNRAHKHNETPTREMLEIALYDALMNEICEWFDFDEATA